MYCNYEDCIIRKFGIVHGEDYEHYHIDEHTITFKKPIDDKVTMYLKQLEEHYGTEDDK